MFCKKIRDWKRAFISANKALGLTLAVDKADKLGECICEVCDYKGSKWCKC